MSAMNIEILTGPSLFPRVESKKREKKNSILMDLRLYKKNIFDYIVLLYAKEYM